MKINLSCSIDERNRDKTKCDGTKGCTYFMDGCFDVDAIAGDLGVFKPGQSDEQKRDAIAKALGVTHADRTAQSWEREQARNTEAAKQRMAESAAAKKKKDAADAAAAAASSA